MAILRKEKTWGHGVGALRSWLRLAFPFANTASHLAVSQLANAPDDPPRDCRQSDQVPNQVPNARAKIDAVTGRPGRPERTHHDASGSSAVVLPFPIHGDALLVRLADMLRQRFVGQRPLREPFLFEVVRGASPKLFIDAKSHATFLPNRAEFRFEFEVKPCTDIVIRTEDFDTLVEFVMQYIVAQLAERTPVEAAS